MADQSSEAERLFRDTISRFPYDVVSRVGLAHLLLRQRRLEEAELVFRETLQMFPLAVPARTGLAETLKSQGRYSEAEAVYRWTVETFPDNVVARNGLAALLADDDASDLPRREPDQLLYSLNRDLATPSNAIPRVIVESNRLLVERVASDPSTLYDLSARAFEEFVAEIFAGFGWEVELTLQTRDHGRDVVAIKKIDTLTTKLLVECKRYSKERKVGISHVRELYAVKSLEYATKCILATTSSFSAEARAMGRRLFYELELKDFDAIAKWSFDYMRRA